MLCSDMEKILSGIGDRLAHFIQWITIFIGGFILGFVSEWRLTLLLVGLTPFLAISGAVFAKVGPMACMFMILHYDVILTKGSQLCYDLSYLLTYVKEAPMV